MKIISTELKDVLIIETDRKYDDRGFKETTLNSDDLSDLKIQFNCKLQNIYNAPKKGTFYGIHFQEKTKPQAKIIYCIQGRGIDYIVDLRKDSPTYKKWISVVISEADNFHIYIPQGYGHAFLTLEKNTKQLFSVDELFYKTYSKKIRYDDKDLNIQYPISIKAISDSDANAPYLADLDFEV